MKSTITSELAELVGILLGDGSISIYTSKKYSTYYRVKVTFHKEDKAYLAYVRGLMNKLLGFQPSVVIRKKENTSDLILCRKQVVEELLALGLQKSPKWNRARVPLAFMTKDLGKFVLKGYFDTDGSVVIANNNGIVYPRLEMKICPSPMQKQLIELLKLYGFEPGVYALDKHKVRVQMNGKKPLFKWVKEIGFSNPKHAEKASKFIS